jgi:hypothetical protein
MCEPGGRKRRSDKISELIAIEVGLGITQTELIELPLNA